LNLFFNFIPQHFISLDLFFFRSFFNLILFFKFYLLTLSWLEITLHNLFDAMMLYNINLDWHQSFFYLFFYSDFIFLILSSTLDFLGIELHIFFVFLSIRLSWSHDLNRVFDEFFQVSLILFLSLFSLTLNIFFSSTFYHFVSLRVGASYLLS
jgi:hypothetical protein